MVVKLKRLKKKIQKVSPWIIIPAIIFVLIGGIIYYLIDLDAGKFRVFSAITGSLQNLAETFLFNPIITVKDFFELLSKEDLSEAARNVLSITVWPFAISLALIPIVELIIISISVTNLFRAFIVDKLSKKLERVLIIGTNPEIEHMLKNEIDEFKIYRWADGFLPNEIKKDFLKRNIIVSENLLSFDEASDSEDSLAECNAFLRKKKISHVLLLDESDAHNIQYYLSLSSCDYCKKTTVHFHVLINSFENKNILQDYFDGQLEKAKNAIEETDSDKINDTRMDLHIFNLQQITTEMTLEKLPLYKAPKKNNKEYGIHMLIVGGGFSGEALLLHAMNQGVITADNNILIDVVDVRINDLKNRLLNRFSKSCMIYSDKPQKIFRVGKGAADGNLVIRLTKCNVNSSDFRDSLKQLQEVSKFNYVALCLSNENLNLHVMKELKACGISDTPLAVRMTETGKMKEFISGSFSGCFSEVYLMGEQDERVGIQKIIDSNKEKQIRLFNSEYNGDKTGNPAQADARWNSDEYYRRCSNRALYFHKPEKKFILDDPSDIKKEYDMFIITDFNPERFLTRTELDKYNGQKKDKDKIQEDIKNAVKNRVLKQGNEFPMLTEFAKIEHRRWNYFFISEGWASGKIKIPARRVHDCIKNWKALTVQNEDKLIYDLLSLPIVIEELEREKSEKEKTNK